MDYMNADILYMIHESRTLLCTKLMLCECRYMNDEASKSADNPWVVAAGTNQDPANLSRGIPPLPSVPWIFCRCWPLIRPARGGVDGFRVGKESIHRRKESGWWWWWWWWGCTGVRAAGFVGQASRPTHRWLITTHNAKHTTYNTIQNQVNNYTNETNYNQTRRNTFCIPRICAMIPVRLVCFKGCFNSSSSLLRYRV